VGWYALIYVRKEITLTRKNNEATEGVDEQQQMSLNYKRSQIPVFNGLSKKVGPDRTKTIEKQRCPKGGKGVLRQREKREKWRSSP